MNPDVVEAFAWVLVHFLWQGTAITLVYKSVDSLGLFPSPRQRYLVGLCCMTCMLLCPVVTFLMRDSFSESTRAVSASPLDESVPVLSAHSGGGNWSFLVMAIWISGVSLQSLRLSLGFRRLRRWKSDLLPLPESLLRRSSEFANRLGLSRFRRVYLSTYVSEAMAVGFFRPVILIPAAWMIQLPVSTLEAVIAHELAHIRRFDLWVNLFQRTVEALLFYHPAVWWLSSKIRDERELCCDEIAARTTGGNLAYAMALEDVARYVYRKPPLLGLSFSGEKNMKLLKRVRHVLGLSTMAKRSLWWPAGLLALLLPLALYASSLVADDDDGDKPDRPAVERRDGDREVRRDRSEDGDRDDDDDDDDRERDRDRPRPDRERAGDRERDGDRPRPDRPDGPPRDGDRPRPDRPDGPPRDGDRPPREGFRPDGPRPDGPRPDGTRPPFGDRDTPFRDRLQEGDRPGPGRPLPPIARQDADLRREVEQLRREVNELRQLLQRQRGLEGPPRREGDARPDGPQPPRGDRPRVEGRFPGAGPLRGERREGDGPPPRGGREPGADRPREGGREGGPDRPREGGRESGADRPREGGREPGSDRPRDGGREAGPDRPREGASREATPERVREIKAEVEVEGERVRRPEFVTEKKAPETKDE